jgi:hypothetical protein
MTMLDRNTLEAWRKEIKLINSQYPDYMIDAIIEYSQKCPDEFEERIEVLKKNKPKAPKCITVNHTGGRVVKEGTEEYEQIMIENLKSQQTLITPADNNDLIANQGSDYSDVDADVSTRVDDGSHDLEVQSSDAAVVPADPEV